MKKLLSGVMIFLATVLCASSYGTTLEFKVKYWMPDFSADVRVDDEDIIGTTVDIDKDLGIDTDEGVVPIELVLHFGDLFRLWFGYTTLSMDGSSVINKEITFAGETFSLNADIDSKVELTGTEAGIEWDFLSSENYGFGPCISAIYFEGSAAVFDNLSLISAEGKLTTVVPAIGGFGRIGFLEQRLEISGRLMGFTLDNDTYIDGVAEAKYNVLKNFGIFAGYHYMSVEVEDSDIYVDASLAGFYVGGLVSF